MSEYNGKLISELGVDLYLKGRQDINYSNIQFFDRGGTLQKKWQECDFGCHGPSYRLLRPSAEWNQTLRLLDKINPFVAGLADGVRHQVVQQPKIIAAGIERTGEGMHLAGPEKFLAVGEENWAAVDLIKTTYKNIMEFDINLIDNPLMQMVTTIINDYIALIPEWVIEEMLNADVIDFKSIDKVLLIKAVAKGTIASVSPEDAELAFGYLKSKAQRIVGKQLGKKLAAAIAAAIATQIAKKVMSDEAITFDLKRHLARLRQAAKPMGGGLGAALVTLLKSQGLLGVAANSSRALKAKCPKTWNTLRFQLHGADMAYFLVDNMIQEYVDRLSLLEKNPQEFLRIMNALIKDKLTKQIFYPGSY